jgi:hypothetical protein
MVTLTTAMRHRTPRSGEANREGLEISKDYEA